MATILWLREQMRTGKSVYDLPLRVTFYARVSTEKVEQRGSLENQVQYYTEFIQKNLNWTYVPGYADEGISGISTHKRDSFLRMIADARRGLFDFIITKEISRFSRSTLDSIRYTQELLDANVGVLFQNDNINTLDPDSEFRLAVMAGVAQDEVRKLSERLKFGFRQSVQNGRVLGNSRMFGYRKKDCRLTVHPEQAEMVRLIFELYATGGYGIRKLSRELTERGYLSSQGNDFNTATLRHILTNPKYKGWYCGNKTRTLDYRTKKREFLDESEWVTYPDPAIPAIVSEELWERANAIFMERSARVKAYGVGYQSRYPYSGKIICGCHGTAFHRQSFKTAAGDTEYWSCKRYRQSGKAGCPLPSVRTGEIDAVLADLFRKSVCRQDEIVDLVLRSISEAERQLDHSGAVRRLQEQAGQLMKKQDKLLELHMDGVISVQEFKQRNRRLNQEIENLQNQRASLQEQARQAARAGPALLNKALWEELCFEQGVNSELAGTILDRAVVSGESTKKDLRLEVRLRLGQTVPVSFSRRAPPSGDCTSLSRGSRRSDFVEKPA